MISQSKIIARSLRHKPKLSGQNFQKFRWTFTSGISHELSYDKGHRAFKADLLIHRRCWFCRWIRKISFISHAPLKISTEWLRGSGGTSINKLTVHPSQIHLHCQGSPSHTADKHTFYPQTLCFSCCPRWLPDRQAKP